jgi:hypothetical protein
MSFLKLETGVRRAACVLRNDAERPKPHFESGDTRTPLLVLYTSEGCSGCPPDEALLSRLKKQSKALERLRARLVPGRKISWRRERYTQRQQGYAAHYRRRFAYTPGFVLDSKEWRGPNRKNLPGLRTRDPECLLRVPTTVIGRCVFNQPQTAPQLPGSFMPPSSASI